MVVPDLVGWSAAAEALAMWQLETVKRRLCARPARSCDFATGPHPDSTSREPSIPQAGLSVSKIKPPSAGAIADRGYGREIKSLTK